MRGQTADDPSHRALKRKGIPSIQTVYLLETSEPIAVDLFVLVFESPRFGTVSPDQFGGFVATHVPPSIFFPFSSDLHKS